MRTLYFVSLIVAVSAFGSAASRSLPRARAAGAHTRVGQGPVDLRQGVRGQQPPARTAEANKPFDPIAAPWPQLTAAEHEAVQQLIDQGKWSEALAELVTILKKRGVTFDTVRGGLPVYDPDLPTQEEGRTSVESMAAGFVLLPRMQIGRAAFQNHATGVYTSIPTSGSHFLYATVMHELVHAWQFYSEGICEHVWHGSKAAEVEAYTTELKNRARAGISPAEIALLRGRLAEYGGPPLPRVVKERRHAADAGPGPYVAAPSRITSAKLRQQPTLRFTIALPKSQFNAGEPVPLSMLVANVSAQTLEVNRRLEINGQQEPRPFREVYLRITMPSGQVALFRWLVTIGVPGRQDVATLAPGQSVGRTQDIADLYTLGQAGTYGVLATYENIMPVHGRWVVTDSVASNRLTFRIGAGPAGSAPAAAAVRYHAAMVPAGGALSAAATPLHAAPSGSAAARPQGAAAAAAPACPAPLPPGAPTPPTPA